MPKRNIIALLVALCLLPFSSSALLGSATITSLTTLPPASPTGNDPCAFINRVNLLDRIESNWQNYNISLLVKTCNTVCPLMYGSGNPDISGIGVSATIILVVYKLTI